MTGGRTDAPDSCDSLQLCMIRVTEDKVQVDTNNRTQQPNVRNIGPTFVQVKRAVFRPIHILGRLKTM